MRSSSARRKTVPTWLLVSSAALAILHDKVVLSLFPSRTGTCSVDLLVSFPSPEKHMPHHIPTMPRLDSQLRQKTELVPNTRNRSKQTLFRCLNSRYFHPPNNREGSIMETWYLRDWRAADFAPRTRKSARNPCRTENESWKTRGGVSTASQDVKEPRRALRQSA